jgi:hypothetical protein
MLKLTIFLLLQLYSLLWFLMLSLLPVFLEMTTSRLLEVAGNSLMLVHVILMRRTAGSLILVRKALTKIRFVMMMVFARWRRGVVTALVTNALSNTTMDLLMQMKRIGLL